MTRYGTQLPRDSNPGLFDLVANGKEDQAENT